MVSRYTKAHGNAANVVQIAFISVNQWALSELKQEGNPLPPLVNRKDGHPITYTAQPTEKYKYGEISNGQ